MRKLKDGVIRRNGSNLPQQWEQYYEGKWQPYLTSKMAPSRERSLQYKYGKAIEALKFYADILDDEELVGVASVARGVLKELDE